MITTIGNTYCVSTYEAIYGMIEAIKRLDERQALANKLEVTLEELDELDFIKDTYSSYLTLHKLAELWDELIAKEEDISSLKKQIKYCKNPMQKKQLEKKLNEAYKKRK